MSSVCTVRTNSRKIAGNFVIRIAVSSIALMASHFAGGDVKSHSKQHTTSLACNNDLITYNVVQISMPNANVLSADRVNDNDDVVGQVQLEDSRVYGFLRKAGIMIVLPGFGGAKSVSVSAISDDGIIIGRSDGIRVLGINAFAFQNGKFTNLGDKTSSITTPRSLNNKGVIVGSISQKSPSDELQYDHAAIYNGNRQWSDLGTLGGKSSWANGINDASIIVGTSTLKNNEYNTSAFIYKDKKMLNLIKDLTVFSSDASAINNRGQVVGSMTKKGRNSAFLCDNGDIEDLGILSGYKVIAARSINEQGVVVGQCTRIDKNSMDPSHRVQNHAFIYKGNTLLDLNDLVSGTSNIEITDARCINNHGTIVGVGRKQGKDIAIILMPNLMHASR